MTPSRLVRHLKVRELGYLVSLGQTHSINRTAVLYGISQPALSKTLTELETAFGMRLFDRSRLGVTPTHWGETIIAEATQIVASIEALDIRLEAERSGLSRVYRVGATPNPALRLIPSAYQMTRTRFSNLSLELVEGSTDDLLIGLRRGDYSLVVGRSSPQDAFSVIRQVPLYPETGVIVARPGHPATGRMYSDVTPLLEFPWVLPQTGPTRSAIELSFMRAGCNPPSPSFINYSIHIVCDLLVRSDALSVLPLGPALPFLAAGTIVDIASKAEFHLPSYAIYRPLHSAKDPVLAYLESSIVEIASSVNETQATQERNAPRIIGQV